MTSTAASEDCSPVRSSYLSNLFNDLKPLNGGLQVPVDQPQQDVSPCLSAPPSLQPFFKDQETAPSGKNTSSPSSQVVSHLHMTQIIIQGDSYHPVTFWRMSWSFQMRKNPQKVTVSSTPLLLSSRSRSLVWMSCSVLCLQLPFRPPPCRLITKYDGLHVCLCCCAIRMDCSLSEMCDFGCPQGFF